MKIMIVDDDVGVRKFMCRALQDDCYVLFEAENGEKAIQTLRKIGGVDLAFIDILMPEKEGLETIREFKTLHPETKIVSMSGGGEISADKYLQISSFIGADKTIKKPFVRRDLIEAISSLQI